MAEQRFQVLLHEKQAEFLSCPAAIRSFVGGRGSGKALAAGTLLPTPTPCSWKCMGNVRPGDQLLDENGVPCRVTAVTPIMEGRPCYEVRFSDGERIVADENHEWLTSTFLGSHLATTEMLAHSILEGHCHWVRTPSKDVRVVSVEPTLSVPVRCVEVDSPSHLYMAGRSGIPTHNSFIGGYDLLVRACSKRNRLYMVVAPCYDHETEILTEQYGWLLFRDLPADARVAALADDMKTMVFVEPRERHDFPFSGELVCAENQEISLAVTPNHRCLARFKDGPWQTVEAQRIEGRHAWHFKKDADWKGEIPQHLGDEIGFEWLGLWFADGWAQASKRKNRVVITQKKRVDYVRDLCRRFAARYAPGSRVCEDGKQDNPDCIDFTIYQKELANLLAPLAGAHKKRLPVWVKGATPGLLRAFLSGYQRGDGNLYKETGYTTCIRTVSKPLADDIQEIATKAGFTANLAPHSCFGTNIWQVNFRQPGPKAQPAFSKKHWFRKPYDGRVYCVEVSGPGFVYVRRHGKAYWCGNTYAVLKNASMRTLLKIGLKLGKITWVNRSDLRIGLDSGSEIIFRSAEHPDRLRGPNLSGVWMDEAQNCDEEAFAISIACLREAGEQGFFTATFTPQGRRHWTFDRFGRNQELREKYNQWLRHQSGEITEAVEEVDPAVIDPDVWLFHSPTRDNPFLPENFEGRLRRQYTSSLARQELEGEFTDQEGLMFQRKWFDGKLVAIAPLQARRVRYWDKAASKKGGSFTAGVLIACDINGAFYVEDVIHGQWTVHERDSIMRMTADSDIRKYGYGAVRIVVEQEPGSGGLESAQNSVRMLAGNIVTKDKVSGKKHVRAEPFAAQCEHGNVFIVTETDARRPWITDFIDELCFGRLTRITTMRGSVPIEEVNRHDKVLTRAGWRQVRQARMTNSSASICQIRTQSGTVLEATPNHPILVLGYGFVSAGQLREGDLLLRRIEETNTDSARTQKTGRLPGTFKEGSERELSCCTVSSTSVRSASFLKAMSFITRTRIRTTTRQKTLRRSCLERTPASICTARHLPLCALCASVISSLGSASSNRERAVEDATMPTSTRLVTRSSTRRSVRCVMCCSVISTNGPSIAARHASERPMESIEGSSLFPADGAKSSFSRQTPDEHFALDVVASLPVMLPGKHAVYNLEVEDVHEFFAEGILVHNCSFPDGDYSDQCLPGEVRVATAEGFRRIDQVRVGQHVWTRQGLRPVTHSSRTGQSGYFIRLVLQDGMRLDGTTNHPVLCSIGGFQSLGRILQMSASERSGMRVAVWNNQMNQDGAPQIVWSKFYIEEVHAYRQPVYNIAVSGVPEYFANGVLVHNCDAASGAFNALIKGGISSPAVGGAGGGGGQGGPGGRATQPGMTGLPGGSAGRLPGPPGMGVPNGPGQGLRNFRPM